MLTQTIGAAPEQAAQVEGFTNLVLVVAALGAVFVVLLAMRLKKDISEPLLQRAERIVLSSVYVTGVAIGGMAILYATSYQHHWGLLLAFLPYLLIIQHMTFLRNVRCPMWKPLGDGGKPDTDGGKPDTDGGKADTEWWPIVLRNAKATTDRYFGPVSLAIRYGTAAIAALLVGLTAYLVLFVDPSILRSLLGEKPDSASLAHLHAAQLGLAGAYVYVLVHLGRRNFTHDVTSGGALWCSIVLAVGPILAAIVSHLLHGEGATAPGPEAFGMNLIYFMAGFSPRFIVAFMENVARKAWGPTSVTTVTSPRTLPITQVGGVTQEVAERLAEEGIYDLHGLAMADPLRLIRNTNFDRREIVSWIDEAMLIDMLPKNWEDFEHEGINGAIDFVSLVFTPPYEQYKADGESNIGIQEERTAYLKVLSSHLKLSDKSRKPDATNTNPATTNTNTADDDIATIRSIARRLVNDAQLRLIWVLHNHIADEDTPAP